MNLDSLRFMQNNPPWQWPDEPGAVILKHLADKKAGADVRMDAANLAGDLVVMNEEMADLMIQIVSDPGEAEGLRARLAIGLGPVLEECDLWMEDDDPEDRVISQEMLDRINETFKKIFSDKNEPKLVRRRALEASVRYGQKWHTKAVEEAFEKKDPDWNLTAVFCMGYVKGFGRQIIQTLESPDPDILYEAVCSASSWDLPEAADKIVSILEKKGQDKDLLLAAIEAAADMMSEKAESALVGLSDSKDPEIRDAASEALLRISGYPEEEDEFDEDFDEDDFDED